MYGRIFTLYLSHPTRTGRENTLRNQKFNDTWLALLENTILRRMFALIRPSKVVLSIRLRVSGRQQFDEGTTA